MHYNVTKAIERSQQGRYLTYVWGPGVAQKMGPVEGSGFRGSGLRTLVDFACQDATRPTR